MTVAFEKRETKKKRNSIGDAAHTTEEPSTKKRKTREMPTIWVNELALAFTFFGPIGFSPKSGSPGNEGGGPPPKVPARQQMREAKKAAATNGPPRTTASSSNPSSSVSTVEGPGSNGRDAHLGQLLAQGAAITAEMKKATKLMEGEVDLDEAKSVVSLISDQLKNPYLSEERQRALWKEHEEASTIVRNLLLKRKAEREVQPACLDVPPLQELPNDSDDGGGAEEVDDDDGGGGGDANDDADRAL